MKPEQIIIERLYREIDVANSEFRRIGSRVRISRCVGLIEIENDNPKPSPKPAPSNIPIRDYTGNVCRVCGGMMVQTGNCQTCTNCGSTSGGCD